MVSVIVLLLGILAGLVITPVLFVWGLVLGVSRKRRSPAVRWKAAALLAGAAAIGMYVWGMVHVFGDVLIAEDGGTDSSPLRPCRAAGMDKAMHVVDYGISFVPLHFECRLKDGGSYATSSVPAYVTPGTAVLGLAGIGFRVRSAVLADRPSPSRRAERAEDGLRG
jgi:hypothetical protein